MTEETLNEGIEELGSAAQQASNPGAGQVNTPGNTNPNSPVPGFLTKPSPDKDVAQYIDHPLNFRESRGLGRMIRGLEGGLDRLDYWPIDVVVGLLQEIWDMVIDTDSKSSSSTADDEIGGQ